MRSLIVSFIGFWMLLSSAYAKPTVDFEIIGKFDEAPGNLAVTADGRFIMSLHQFYEPEHSVVERLPDNSLIPFPNKAWNARTGDGNTRLDSVLGIKADGNGIVWMLDNGLRSGVTPKLVAWDTKKNKLHRVIKFPESVAPRNAFVNDLAIDNLNQRIFISDPAGGSNAALIVVNLKTGKARRVLEGDKSVVPENIDLLINKRPLQVKDKAGKLSRPHIGVNPITEDLKNEWVYFGAMHGRSLYRIRAKDLANEKLSNKALAAKIERYSDKPLSDGITIDKASNIYLGELAENAIGMVNAKQKYQRLAQSDDLAWVDSLCFSAADGWVYAVTNRLNLSAPLNAGERLSKPPYYLLRLKAASSN